MLDLDKRDRFCEHYGNKGRHAVSRAGSPPKPIQYLGSCHIFDLAPPCGLNCNIPIGRYPPPEQDRPTEILCCALLISHTSG